MPKTTFTVAEVAERWSCAATVVLRRIRSGELPAFNLATDKRPTYRVKLADVEAFEQGRSTAKAVTPKPQTKRGAPRLARHELTWK